jgi:hypothetical protein
VDGDGVFPVGLGGQARLQEEMGAIAGRMGTGSCKGHLAKRDGKVPVKADGCKVLCLSRRRDLGRRA